MNPLADALARALDPVRTVDDWEPDPWQAQVLRSSATQVLLNCSRQAGKSTVSSVMAVHTASVHPRCLVLLVSPSQRQSGELLAKAKAFSDLHGYTDGATASSLTLTNGSRILSLPGSEGTIRGFSAPRLIIVDEASRVDDSLYASLRPMLAVSGGRLIALSTPFGKRGWFYNAWEEGGRHWERVRVPATEIPRITSAFLDSERRELGDWMFRQEYLCEFVDDRSSLYRASWIEAARSSTIQPLDLTLPHHDERNPLQYV